MVDNKVVFLLQGRVGLAPMEGVIDAHARDLLTRLPGFDWAVTEFVRVVDARLPPRVFWRHCPELTAGVATPAGVPVTLQLLGSDPVALAANASQARALGAHAIDLNFGCPAKLVNRHDGGASLLRDPRRVHAAVAAVHGAVGFEIPDDALDRLDPEILRKWPQGLHDLMSVIEDALTQRGATPEQARQVAFVVVRALAQFAGGRSIYLPKGEALDRALRDRAIWERFDGYNISELAARAELTEVQVYAIIAEQRKLARQRVQPGLF